MEMSPIDAAKILLQHILYLNATCAERDAGFYPPVDARLLPEAIKKLQEQSEIPEDLVPKLKGADCMVAAMAAAQKCFLDFAEK